MKKHRARALMVLGTASHVGKSLTVAALCRILHQDGFRVAPFKSQNMALNSFVTPEGHEIGRAQAMQAQAAGIEPHVDMNPILLKPSSEMGAQVVLNGRVWDTVRAGEFQKWKSQLFAAVIEAYERLAARYEVIILEGAGSPVEMNLKAHDIANLKMAEAAHASCLLVADIDRGGVFASLVGTYELLTLEERRRFGGFLINKFRGDFGLLRPGIRFLESRLGQPCLGVVPYLPGLNIDEEDGVALDGRPENRERPSSSPEVLRVGIVRLPHIANFSDFVALSVASQIAVFYAQRPNEASAADVLILPGSKNTMADLYWLWRTGWAETILAHARRGGPIVGICGGFQMLGREVRDPFHVESARDSVPGLGLLDVTTSLGREKITRQARAQFVQPDAIGVQPPGPVFVGYEIHMGETSLGAKARPFFRLIRRGERTVILDGAISPDGRIIGTYLHGLFDAAEGAAALLAHFGRLCGRTYSIGARHFAFDREEQYDALAEHFRRHLDVAAIYRLLEIGSS